MGRLHVDEMLGEMEPREFAEWHAYWLIEPWGDEWRQVGRNSANVVNAILRLCSIQGGKVEDDDWQHEEDYMPQLADEEDEPEATIEEIAELNREWYGPDR